MAPSSVWKRPLNPAGGTTLGSAPHTEQSFPQVGAGYLIAMPYIGTAIFLIALGGILAFAVTEDTASEGFSVQTAGVVLLVIGVLVLALRLLWQFALSDRERGHHRVADAEPVVEREVAPRREVEREVPPRGERVVERERRF